jgi:type IV secretory pathway TraG/TraD family ATPase VirD4
MYVVGKTGVGKSSLLAVLALQDLVARRGFALVDPHGELAERIHRAAVATPDAKVVYLNATDPAQPYGYNPLRRVRDDRIPLAASGVLETFRKLWPDAWGVRMEYVLRNTLYALLERDGSTLRDILRLYADAAFRKAVTAQVRNEVVRSFWTTEFAKYPDRYRLEVTAPIQNKVGALLADPTLRRILLSPETDVRFRRLMDEGGVFIANLSKGQLGEGTAAVLGSLIVSTIGLAALSRADVDSESRPPYFLYADEFQTFTTLAFANMMAELRKYQLGLVLSHQHSAQVDHDVRQAVLGNAGTFIMFRLGADDANRLVSELQPRFRSADILCLPNRYFYLKLMIDGAPSPAFSAKTINL